MQPTYNTLKGSDSWSVCYEHKKEKKKEKTRAHMCGDGKQNTSPHPEIKKNPAARCISTKICPKKIYLYIVRKNVCLNGFYFSILLSGMEYSYSNLYSYLLEYFFQYLAVLCTKQNS